MQRRGNSETTRPTHYTSTWKISMEVRLIFRSRVGTFVVVVVVVLRLKKIAVCVTMKVVLSFAALSLLFSRTFAFVTKGGAAPFGCAPSAQRFSSPAASAGQPHAAVAKKDSYDITLLPGDGIGPEITTATKVALESLCQRCGFELNTKEALIGGAAIDAVNDPFPPESLAQCLASDSVLLACIGGYKWDTNPRELRPETGLLRMRKEMGLFANLRPAKVLPQLIEASTLKPEVVEGVDVMVVRELTGDVYFGTPKGIDVVDGKAT